MIDEKDLEKVSGGTGIVTYIERIRSSSLPQEIKDKLCFYLKKYGITAARALAEKLAGDNTALRDKLRAILS